MTTRVVKTEADIKLLVRYLYAQKRPFTVDITKGAHRTVEQNRLQRLWMNEIAEQLGDMTPEEARGYCKLTIGVPILRADNEGFRERYDAVLKPLGYEQKLQIMMEPLDLPVTRLMTTVQKSTYLDRIVQHFAEQGVRLTQPEAA